ncbi:MAG: hypothetical protein ACM37W_23395 [Actinomycetota bacterium]
MLVEQERNRAIGITSLTLFSGAVVGNYTPVGSLGGATIALLLCLNCLFKPQKKPTQRSPTSSKPTEVFIGADGLVISQKLEEKP